MTAEGEKKNVEPENFKFEWNIFNQIKENSCDKNPRNALYSCLNSFSHTLTSNEWYKIVLMFPIKTLLIIN